MASPSLRPGRLVLPLGTTVRSSSRSAHACSAETLQVHLRHAAGEPLRIFNRILEEMQSPEVWSFLDFWRSGSLHGGCVQRMEADHAECRLQSARPAGMFQMVMALLHQKLLYAAVPLYSYPYRMVLLAPSDKAFAQATLLHFKKCREADTVEDSKHKVVQRVRHHHPADHVLTCNRR